MTATRTAAHTYADRGWPVFILSATKTPVRNCHQCRAPGHHDTEAEMEACTCLCCHGFYAATRDHDRINAMHAAHPDGLLAIRTGAPSRLVCVDVDVTDPDNPDEPGWATLAALEDAGLLPPTLTAVTGSRGLHLLYAHPGIRIGSGAGRLGPKVDVKADGAYIVAAPSVHPRTRRPYAWSSREGPAPAAAPLHHDLVEHLRDKPPPPRSPSVIRDARRATEGRLAGALAVVLGAADGERNGRLYWAACIAGVMLTDRAVDEAGAVAALEGAGRAIGLPDREITATIRSGLRKGLAGHA